MRFLLLGECCWPSFDALHPKDLKSEYAEYLGKTEDVREHIAQSYCVVLPSNYKEGVPRVLLESISMAKPIITTNTPGCKEVVAPPFIKLSQISDSLLQNLKSEFLQILNNPSTPLYKEEKPSLSSFLEEILVGQNGVLIPPKDEYALLLATLYIINLPSGEYKKLTLESRNYALKRFHISHTLCFYEKVISSYIPPSEPASNRNIKEGTQKYIPHLVFVNNSAFGLFNFRLNVLKKLQENFTITLICPKDEQGFFEKLEKQGFKILDLPLSPKGLNPIKDLQTFLTLRSYFLKLKPDMVFNYTIKPIIYGSLAAKKIKNIAITTGLGYIFSQNSSLGKKILKKLVCKLYQFSLTQALEVWFLNAEDREKFLEYKLVPKAKTKILDSEGVDCEYFQPDYKPSAKNKNPNPSDSSTNPTIKNFLFIGRMLKSKGVEEFLRVASMLKTSHCRKKIKKS